MFFEKIATPGLAHYSYVMGDGDAAAVVDPRRDVEAYLDVARRHNATIRLIFETHRNEDLVSGAPLLARSTGARVLHGRKLDFGYGDPVEHEQTFELGGLRLRVLETPGHTDESISIVIHAPDAPEQAWGVCTGDALFMGGVGRTDFHPQRAEEDAAALWDSIFERLLPLGSETLLFPAHGAGSVCGQGLAERPASTLGYEADTSEVLQLDREAFIRAKLEERHSKPPYFARMEQLNLEGASAPASHELLPLTPGSVADRRDDGAVVLDVRSPEAFSGAHVPGSLGIPKGLVSSYAGWFLPYDAPTIVVAEDREDAEDARTQLTRIGYDRVQGFLRGGVTAWETSGRALGRVRTVSVDELEASRAEAAPPLVLDVRTADEFDAAHVPSARHVHLGQVPTALPQMSRDRPVITFCGSGQRASVAASLLVRAGFEDVGVCLGSMKAWSARGLPSVSES